MSIDEEDRFTAMHHPFTMPMEEDLPLIDSDPGRVRAKAYDIVLNGNEMGGGSVRIFIRRSRARCSRFLDLRGNRHRSSSASCRRIQVRSTAARWSCVWYGSYGYADGGGDSIRDVIAFPKVKDASRPDDGSTVSGDPKQLQELGLAVVAKEEKKDDVE